MKTGRSLSSASWKKAWPGPGLKVDGIMKISLRKAKSTKWSPAFMFHFWVMLKNPNVMSACCSPVVTPQF